MFKVLLNGLHDQRLQRAAGAFTVVEGEVVAEQDEAPAKLADFVDDLVEIDRCELIHLPHAHQLYDACGGGDMKPE